MSDRATFVICGFRAHVQQRQQQLQQATSNKQPATSNSDSSNINSVVPLNSWSKVRLSICPFVHRLAFGRRISIEIDFVLCSLKFYVHKVYFDLPRRVVVAAVVLSSLSFSLRGFPRNYASWSQLRIYFPEFSPEKQSAGKANICATRFPYFLIGQYNLFESRMSETLR